MNIYVETNGWMDTVRNVSMTNVTRTRSGNIYRRQRDKQWEKDFKVINTKWGTMEETYKNDKKKPCLCNEMSCTTIAS